MKFKFDVDEIVVFKRRTFTENPHLWSYLNKLEDNTVCVINSKRYLPLSGNMYYITVIHPYEQFIYVSEESLVSKALEDAIEDLDSIINSD